jgi:hypothetical protein
MYLRKSIRSYKGGSYTNYLLVESLHTAKGPRQKTVCSLGDLGPRPRAEWLKLAHKIEDALVGQADLLDPADGEVAAILRRVKRRQASKAAAGAPAPPRADAGLIKVDPSRVSSDAIARLGRCMSAISFGAGSSWIAFCASAGFRKQCSGSPV